MLGYISSFCRHASSQHRSFVLKTIKDRGDDYSTPRVVDVKTLPAIEAIWRFGCCLWHNQSTGVVFLDRCLCLVLVSA